MKLMKNKTYLQKKYSWKVLVLHATVDFTSRVSKSYVHFKCKFPMVMDFVLILHKRCRSKTTFYVFIYDKTSQKFCASFRLFLPIFVEKFQKTCYLDYVRRGIDSYYDLWKLTKDNHGSNETRLLLVMLTVTTRGSHRSYLPKIIMAAMRPARSSSFCCWLSPLEGATGVVGVW